MKLKLGGNLEIGDPILISYGSSIDFGLFAGYGKNSIQYYIPEHIVYEAKRAISNGRKPRFWKAYIHGLNIEYRVAKVTPDVLYNEEKARNYEEAIDILKQENVIK